MLTREPGGSPGAEIMRYILLSGAARPLGPNAEAVLFAAARDDHLTTLIRPALEQGKWVVCDRFADSTRVYQGVAGKVDPMAIRAMERIIVGDTRPDLTFILDVPAKEGMRRAASRRGKDGADRFEAEALAFHEKLRDGFLTLAANEPDRCVLIDATMPKEEVVGADLARGDQEARSGDRADRSSRMWRARRPDEPRQGPTMTNRRIRARRRRCSAMPRPSRRCSRPTAAGRIPHAWLIGGERGIGKATLAYRMARFVLAYPDPAAAGGAEGHVARRSAGSSGRAAHRRAGAQRSPGAGARRQRKDRQAVHRDPRRAMFGARVSFFGSTAGEGGWRVAIVDPIEDLNRNGENALLKVLEEPPPRALLLLVSHAPGRVLPTIRSRCRTLILRPLAGRGRGARRGGGARRSEDQRRNPRRRRGGRRLGRPRADAARGRRARTAPAGGRRCSNACRDSIRARCTRSATRSPAPRPRRSRPSWTPSTPGSALA